MEVIDLDAERDKRGNYVCANCGRPDSETRREHELYCDECLTAMIDAE